jgi:hypothetical protein
MMRPRHLLAPRHPGVRWETISKRAIYRIISNSEYANYNSVEDGGRIVWYAESVMRSPERAIQMEAMRRREQVTVVIYTNTHGQPFESDCQLGVYRHTGRTKTLIGVKGRRLTVFELELADNSAIRRS